MPPPGEQGPPAVIEVTEAVVDPLDLLVQLRRRPSVPGDAVAVAGVWTFAVFTRGEFVEFDTPAGGQVLAVLR
jgi:hypothetical protein